VLVSAGLVSVVRERSVYRERTEVGEVNAEFPDAGADD
jgi:hypothetical protein